MFQPANTLTLHTGERDNKLNYWTVFLHGLTPPVNTAIMNVLESITSLELDKTNLIESNFTV